MRELLLTCLVLFGSPQLLHAHELLPGIQLEPGKQFKSLDGRFALIFQTDGNLVWLHGAHVLWHSKTDGTKDATCLMQKDGNLVIYGSRNGKWGDVWASNTAGRNGASLVCQSDGNLVIYQSGNPLWKSDTVMPKVKPEIIPVQVEELRRGYKVVLSKVVAEQLCGVLNDKVDEEIVAKLLQGSVAVAVAANPELTPPGQAAIITAADIIIYMAKNNLAKFKKDLSHSAGGRGVTITVDGSTWVDNYTPPWMDYLSTDRLVTEAFRFVIRKAPVSEELRSKSDTTVMVATKTPVLAVLSSAYWTITPLE